MDVRRRQFFHLAVGAAALTCRPGIGSAQAYPSRPITMSVPYAAGGPLDVMVRVLADGLRPALGQSIVIENVAGAGGSIGVVRAARAAPDGYTISTGNWAAAPRVRRDLPAAHRSSQGPRSGLAHSVRGGSDHRAGELPRQHAARADRVAQGQSRQGLRRNERHRWPVLHVLGGPLPGEVRDQVPTGALPRRRAGPARPRRRADRPHDHRSGHRASPCPRRRRQGLRGDGEREDFSGSYSTHHRRGRAARLLISGLVGPAGAARHPDADRREARRRRARGPLADPDVRKRFDAMAIEIPAPDTLGPAPLAALQKAEIETWWPMIKSMNIKGERVLLPRSTQEHRGKQHGAEHEEQEEQDRSISGGEQDPV